MIVGKAGSDVVFRHWKERRSKCSLTPLEGREDLDFVRAHPERSFDASGFTTLALGAPLLSGQDRDRPFLLLDSTWRLLPQLQARLTGNVVPRSLPPVVTAYPRVSKVASDPHGGLASVEALYLARLLMGRGGEALLAHYHWRDTFLARLRECQLPGL